MPFCAPQITQQLTLIALLWRFGVPTVSPFHIFLTILTQGVVIVAAFALPQPMRPMLLSVNMALNLLSNGAQVPRLSNQKERNLIDSRRS